MKSYNLTQFRKDLSELSIELDKNQEEQFMQYYELLIQWNEVMNLTAITDFDEVLKKHFVDSLSLIKAVPELTKEGYSVIDVGTGARFSRNPFENRISGIKGNTSGFPE